MALQLVGETLTSEKTGAATATVSYYDKNDIPNVPSRHRGLRLTKTDTRQQEDGGYIKTATYEGRSEDVEEGGGGGGGGGNENRVDNAIYEWSPTFEQTDIAKHPNIKQLLKDYQGEQDASGNIIWPPTLSSEQQGGSGLSEGQEDTGTTNPMYGVTEFLSLGGVWSETSLENSLPADVFTSIGELSGSPPGGIPTPPKRFWLTMPPIVVEHGDKWKVTRRWLLSGVASARDVEAAQKIYSGAGQ